MGIRWFWECSLFHERTCPQHLGSIYPICSMYGNSWDVLDQLGYIQLGNFFSEGWLCFFCIFLFDSLLMEEIRNSHLGYIKPVVNTGIKCQTQLVSRICSINSIYQREVANLTNVAETYPMMISQNHPKTMMVVRFQRLMILPWHLKQAYWRIFHKRSFIFKLKLDFHHGKSQEKSPTLQPLIIRNASMLRNLPTSTYQYFLYQLDSHLTLIESIQVVYPFCGIRLLGHFLSPNLYWLTAPVWA